MLAPFPSGTREQIEFMIEQDGRPVSFYNVTTLSGCSDCSLDPIANTSTDSFCPTCSGNYWIPTYSGWEVTAHVTWGKVDEKAWMTGGLIDNGDCTVKFMHTQEREDLVNDAEYVVVDGREMDVVNVIPRGVPEINRIIVKLKEKER
jgi:hypothetical protein